jgi:nonsense-mediated mRNA decay protein 3
MKLSRFCAKCGKILPDLKPSKRFDEDNNMTGLPETFLCDDCLPQAPADREIPDEIILRRCFRCGAYSLQKDDQNLPWIYQPDGENEIDFLTRILYEQIFFKAEKKGKASKKTYQLFLPSNAQIIPNRPLSLIVRVQSDYRGNQPEREIQLQIKERHCDNCSKKMGGRFDAIIQLRVFSEKDFDQLEEIMKSVANFDESQQMMNSSRFISKIEIVTNGYDLKVSDNIMLKALVANLRANHPFLQKISKSLIGVDSQTGGELYRTHILLKLAPVNRGDFIKLDDKVYRVKNITKNRVIVEEPVSHKTTQFPFSVFEKKKYHHLGKEWNP